jgi:hypothetical protein
MFFLSIKRLVWKSTTKVGHGVAFAVDPSYPSYTKVILCADYQSPGNYAGQFQANVLPPTSSAQTTAAPTAAPSTAASTTKASSSTTTGSNTALTTDAQATTALAKSGTTVLMIWNSGCPTATQAKVSFFKMKIN